MITCAQLHNLSHFVAKLCHTMNHCNFFFAVMNWSWLQKLNILVLTVIHCRIHNLTMSSLQSQDFYFFFLIFCLSRTAAPNIECYRLTFAITLLHKFTSVSPLSGYLECRELRAIVEQYNAST